MYVSEVVHDCNIVFAYSPGNTSAVTALEKFGSDWHWRLTTKKNNPTWESYVTVVVV